MSAETCRVLARINLMTPEGMVPEGEETTLLRADAEMLAADNRVHIIADAEPGATAKRGNGGKA